MLTVRPSSTATATIRDRSMPPTHALSLKQPWAALLVHGRKSIEVRNWSTPRRGRILIHAAGVPDSRPEAWAHVPPELMPAAKLAGGIIGEADLTGCVAYRTLEEFAAHRLLHLNDPSWFKPPVMYGFTFANMAVTPFRRLPGWMRFFPVPNAPRCP
jgi:ASCH domain